MPDTGPPDHPPVSWGEPGTRLLPGGIRTSWGNRQLTNDLARATGSPPGQTCGQAKINRPVARETLLRLLKADGLSLRTISTGTVLPAALAPYLPQAQVPAGPPQHPAPAELVTPPGAHTPATVEAPDPVPLTLAGLAAAPDADLLTILDITHRAEAQATAARNLGAPPPAGRGPGAPPPPAALSPAGVQWIAYETTRAPGTLRHRLPFRHDETARALWRHHGPLDEDVVAFLEHATLEDLLAVPDLAAHCLSDLVMTLEGTARDLGQEPPRPVPRPAHDMTELPYWADTTLGSDPRYTDLLPPGATVRRVTDSLRRRDPVRAARLLRQLTERTGADSSRTLEGETEAILYAGAHGARRYALSLLIRRYGLAGEPPRTLDAIGRQEGVTRERVRQILKTADPRDGTWQPWTPVLDEVVGLVRNATPCTPRELDETLRASGLTGTTWTVDALRSTAAFLGTDIDLGEGSGLVGPAAAIAAAAAVLSRARRLSDANGAVRTDELYDGHLDDTLVDQLIAADPAMRPLGDRWWWADHPGARNRLVNTSRRLLSIQQPQTLDDLQEAAFRVYEFRNSSGRRSSGKPLTVPPRSTLDALYRTHPLFAVAADGAVTCTTPMDEDEIGVEKSALVAVLRSQPHPAMSRNALVDACAEMGMSRATVGIFTSYAECITRVAPNVWGLRGVVIPTDFIDEVREQARRSRAAFDPQRQEGTTPGGLIWFAQRISSTFVNSGVLPNTWRSATLNDRRITVVDALDGEDTGTLRFADAFNHGYNRILRKRNAMPGDVIRVTIELSAGRAHIEIGEDELLEEPPDL